MIAKTPFKMTTVKDEKEAQRLMAEIKAVEDSAADLQRQRWELEKKINEKLAPIPDLREKAMKACPHWRFKQTEWCYDDHSRPVYHGCEVCGYIINVPPGEMVNGRPNKRYEYVVNK